MPFLVYSMGCSWNGFGALLGQNITRYPVVAVSQARFVHLEVSEKGVVISHITKAVCNELHHSRAYRGTMSDFYSHLRFKSS